MTKKRIIGVDVFRGFAILLMLLFHFAYDLNYFQFIHFNFEKDTFWVYSRYVIVSMFLFSVGVSLTLTHHPKISWKKVHKRTLILGISALLVTLLTYIQFPHRWVYFGVLHFIVFASLVGLVFIPHPRLSFITASFILVGSYVGFLHTHNIYNFLKTPLHLPTYTVDLVMFFPWYAVVLLGIAVVGFKLHHSLFNYPLLTHNSRLHTSLAFIGRHALLIYLIHQPIIFGIVMFFSLNLN